jgi:hypothetical protein
MSNNNDPCLGVGLCLTWSHGEYVPEYSCKHECEVVKCPNFVICGNKRPQWLLGTYKNRCYHCYVQLRDSKLIIILKSMCSLCNTPQTNFVEYSRCKHLQCVSCLNFKHYLTDTVSYTSRKDVKSHFKISCPICTNNTSTNSSLKIYLNYHSRPLDII